MSYRGGIFEAIKSLQPYASFGLRDNDYDTLEWYDDPTVVPMPTKEEVLNEHEKLKFEYESNDYARKREAEYPPMTDYLDAIYHQSKGDNSKMNDYLAKCEEVKNKYPKP
jgi:hypothetical protein